jgi:FAD synthetase
MQPPKPQIGNPFLQQNGHPPSPPPSNQTPTPFTDPLLPPTQLPLPELCARIYDRVTAFLAEDATTEHLRSAQEQTRISLKVIEDALKKYRYEIPYLPSSHPAKR